MQTKHKKMYISCKMCTFILYILATLFSISTGYEIEQISDLQGLRFEEIGELKLITKYNALVFHVNISTVDELIKNATENLELIEKLYEDDPKRISDIEKLKTNLALRGIELEDILYGFIKSTQNKKIERRHKRGLFGLSYEDGRNIEKDLIKLAETSNRLIDVSDALKKYARNVSDFLNSTVEELGKRVTIANAITVNDEVERKVNAIIDMLTRGRLNGDIITITEFMTLITNITGNLTQTEELPYRKVVEYYYNLGVNHMIDGKMIKLEMDVPIIEQSSRKLYKITEIPARDQDKLIVTDVEWKYIAINSNESMLMMSLDSCYKHTKSMFYCESESPIKSISHSPDCVTNALVNEQINMKLCKTAVVETLRLTFIRLNDGQYYYYTPTNETLNITCRAETKTLNLPSSSIGILNLESGCKAVANEYTLIKTVRYQESPYIKQNILSVSFDIDEVKKSVRKHNTPIVDKFYLDSLSTLREMAIEIPDVPKIDRLHFAASYGTFEILQYFLIVVLAIFIVHVLYKTYIWALHSCKSPRKEEKDVCKKKTVCEV